MLRINELQPGHKVSGKGLHEGRVLTITTIEYFEGEGYVLFFEEHDEGEYLHDCLGIPITAELLLNAGFVQSTVDPGPCYGKGFNPVTRGYQLVLEWSDEMGCFYFQDAGHPVRYVHQLQSLYLVLTGTALDTKLTSCRLLDGRRLEAIAC